MGTTPQQETVGDGQHYWSRPETSFDITKVKPHACMVNIEQRGNYIHCFDGNHGMRIPAGKILDKDDAGNWIIKDIQVLPSQDLPSDE